MSDRTRLNRLTKKDNDEIHYQCGGRFNEISDPFWFYRGDPFHRSTMFVRCDRCRLAGELIDPGRGWH